jgi:cob(I)alamin adenosyltransferase
MIHSMEHWRSVVEQDEDPIVWAAVALGIIGRLALFPEEYGLIDEVANSARACLARVPDDLFVLGAEFERQFQQQLQEEQKHLDEIDQDLENFDFDEG